MSDKLSLINSSRGKKNIRSFDRATQYVIGDHTNECVYKRGAVLNNTHWGQLKLFTSELLFLTNYYDPSEVKDLIYIGAAPGDHLDVLSKLFPSLTFHLYDKADFNPELGMIKNIKINNTYFDKDDVKEWKDINCLLISDIRTVSYDSSKTLVDDLKENEEIVWKDMNLQRSWVEEIEPLYSLLKFRLPYAEEFELEKGKIRTYLDGIVYTQPFCKSSSSETRLCVFGKQITERDWDILSYEKKLFYHNSVTRSKHTFKNPLNNSTKNIYPQIGLYNDFDSVYLTNVVIDYMKKINREITEESVKKLLKYIINNIKKDINLNIKRDR